MCFAGREGVLFDKLKARGEQYNDVSTASGVQCTRIFLLQVFAEKTLDMRLDDVFPFASCSAEWFASPDGVSKIFTFSIGVTQIPSPRFLSIFFLLHRWKGLTELSTRLSTSDKKFIGG